MLNYCGAKTKTVLLGHCKNHDKKENGKQWGLKEVIAFFSCRIKNQQKMEAIKTKFDSTKYKGPTKPCLEAGLEHGFERGWQAQKTRRTN